MYLAATEMSKNWPAFPNSSALRSTESLDYRGFVFYHARIDDITSQQGELDIEHDCVEELDVIKYQLLQSGSGIRTHTKNSA